MKQGVVDVLREHLYLFSFFDEVYIFGSAISKDDPNDVDVLLVYDEQRLENLRIAKVRLATSLGQLLPSSAFHFTTLSNTELVQTNFLDRVNALKFLI